MSLVTNLLYIFSVIGILDTSYLIYHKVTGTEVKCLFFPPAWCRKVQHASQSKTFGIPNSFAGFTMYTLIFLLTYLYTNGAAPFWTIQAVVGFGFLFSMYFTYVQAFVLKAFCTWCVVSAINFVVMTVAVFLL